MEFSILETMKKTYIYILLALFFTSCEKVIDIDLNDSEPRIVVDAQVLNYGPGFDGNAVVKLSWTSNFYETNTFRAIENAKVMVTDANGNKHQLSSQEPGIYRNPSIPQAQMGDHYNLEITVDGKTIKSSSTIARQVKIDSLSYSIDAFGPKQNEGFMVNCHFTDPANEVNYYYMKLKINNIYSQGYFITRDDGLDGKPMTYTFFRNLITVPSQVYVELYTLDEAAFEYFKVLAMMEQGGMSTAPGNPPSNIEGDAIGLFKAGFVDVKSISIP